jgi:predicted nucleic acid-binding protein
VTPPVSYDSGMLISLDRGARESWAMHRRLLEAGRPPHVSAIAVAEAWRGGRNAQLARALQGCVVEPVDEDLARRAGEARAAVEDASTAEAVIAAAAARAGAVLMTGDERDLTALAGHFRSLRISPV